ncbi:hypothetical protein [Paenibacillus odorifer]|nr:hypothetical protein [Paenibacillus odorifer]
MADLRAVRIAWFTRPLVRIGLYRSYFSILIYFVKVSDGIALIALYLY